MSQELEKRKLRWAALALIAAVAVAGGAYWAQRAITYTEPAPNPSASAPGGFAAIPAASRAPLAEFAFTDGDGKPQSLAQFKGKVVLVNLWATWCPPCVAEMPSLDKVQAQLGGDAFQVVAVSLDRNGAPQVRRYFDRVGLKSLAIYNADPNHFVDAMLPTTYLLDAQGRVAWQGQGAQEWDGPEAMAAIKALLAETKG